jgi:hypothetical protein
MWGYQVIRESFNRSAFACGPFVPKAFVKPLKYSIVTSGCSWGRSGVGWSPRFRVPAPLT